MVVGGDCRACRCAVEFVIWSCLLAFGVVKTVGQRNLRRTNKPNRARRLAVSELFFREREGVAPGGHDVCWGAVGDGEVGEEDESSDLTE